MEMDKVARADAAIAAEVRNAAHALNLAILKAANAGLLVTVDVQDQDLEDDSQTETGVAPSVEVTIDKA